MKRNLFNRTNITLLSFLVFSLILVNNVFASYYSSAKSKSRSSRTSLVSSVPNSGTAALIPSTASTTSTTVVAPVSTSNDSETGEYNLDDVASIYQESSYKSSTGRKNARICAQRYCEGNGDPYGKCFNTSFAETILMTNCMEELDESGHDTRAMYDFIASMNNNFLSACHNINADLSDEEVFSGDEIASLAPIHMEKFLYKKSRINTSGEILAIPDWNLEFEERYRADKLMSSDCADDLDTSEDGTPVFVKNGKYCINDYGFISAPEDDGDCPSDYSTSQIYSAPKEIETCGKNMYAYEGDGYYKYERLSTYRSTDGKCPVYIGYGPLEKGTTTEQGVSINSGNYYPKLFHIGQTARLYCTYSMFGLAEENMTYKVKMKDDISSMSKLITGILDTTVSGVGALTSGVNKAKLKEKAYLTGGMCDKKARVSHPDSCDGNGWICVVDGEKEDCDEVKTYLADDSSYEWSCLKKKGFISLKKKSNVDGGKYVKPGKGILFTEGECTKAGGTFYKNDDDNVYACFTDGKYLNKVEKDCKDKSSAWVAIKCDDKSTPAKRTTCSGDDCEMFCSNEKSPSINYAGGNLSYTSKQSKLNKELSSAKSDLYGNGGKCEDDNKNKALEAAEDAWNESGEDEALFKAYYKAQQAVERCAAKAGGSATRLGITQSEATSLENAAWEAENSKNMFDTKEKQELVLNMGGGSSYCESVAENQKMYCLAYVMQANISAYQSGTTINWSDVKRDEPTGDYDMIKKICGNEFDDKKISRNDYKSYKSCLSELSNEDNEEAQMQQKMLQSKLTRYQQIYKVDAAAYKSAQAGLASLEKEKEKYSSNITSATNKRSNSLNGMVGGGAMIVEAVMQNKQNEYLVDGKCVITDKTSSSTGAIVANEGEKITLEYDMF